MKHELLRSKEAIELEREGRGDREDDRDRTNLQNAKSEPGTARRRGLNEVDGYRRSLSMLL